LPKKVPDPLAPRILKLTKAWADNRTGLDSDVGLAIDKSDDTGWKTEAGKPHFAVFELAEPVNATVGTTLRVTLECKWGQQHNLGRFRLSVSRDPAAFDREQQRVAAIKLTDPWPKLAAAYALDASKDEAVHYFAKALQRAHDRAGKAQIIAAAAPHQTVLLELARSAAKDGQFQAELARYYAEHGHKQLADAAFMKARALFEKQLATEPDNSALAAELAQLLFDKVSRPGVVRGQFVRLDLPGDSRQFPRHPDDGDNKTINLAELQVFQGDQNIALRKKARQSSSLAGINYAPQNAVDGNTAGNDQGNPYAHTGFEKDPWWEVDLGSDQAIDRIVIWNRIEPDAYSKLYARMNHFRVRVLDGFRRVVFEQVVDKAPNPSTTIVPQVLVAQTNSGATGENQSWILPSGARVEVHLAAGYALNDRNDKAVEYYRKALQADPKLGNDRGAQYRYHAARAAALAAAGQGKETPPLDGAAKAKLRRQALDWLRAELNAWGKLLTSSQPENRQLIVRTLWYWQHDSALAGIRDKPALDKLPESELKAFAQFWAEVAKSAEPANNAERLKVAQAAYDSKLFALSTRLWAEAFAKDPKLADNPQTHYRFSAARAAALAAAQGKQALPLEDAAKAKLRSHALDWLKAELAGWSKLLKSGTPQARLTIVD
jgi:hypothetical protein